MCFTFPCILSFNLTHRPLCPIFMKLLLRFNRFYIGLFFSGSHTFIDLKRFSTPPLALSPKEMTLSTMISNFRIS